MSDIKEEIKIDQTPSQAYGLAELDRGVYFDKKLKQKLILKQNYVECSGDEFQKKYTAMILYCYEGGKDRTDTAQAFVEWGEENLDIVELFNNKNKIDDVIETTGGIVPGETKPDNVPCILDTEQSEFKND